MLKNEMTTIDLIELSSVHGGAKPDNAQAHEKVCEMAKTAGLFPDYWDCPKYGTAQANGR